jgi:hypothetical protein
MVDIELDNGTLEYYCQLCAGNFVELPGQGIEHFTSIGHTYGTGPEVEAETSDNDDRDLDTESGGGGGEQRHTEDAIQQILSRVLGSSTNLMPVLSAASGGSSTPMAVIIRSPPMTPSAPPMPTRNRGDLMSMLIEHGLFSGMFSGMSDSDAGNSYDGRSFQDLLHHLMMTESSHANTPATQEAIDSLERIRINSSSDAESLGQCGISLESFDTGDTVVRLSCTHSYKEESILEWFKQQDSCPICRKKV